MQEALHVALGVQPQGRFVAEHAPDRLVTDPGYLGVHRSSDVMIVQITLNKGRDAAQKLAFFRAAVEILEKRARARPADVAISLVEGAREDWSFGDGKAQLG